MPLRVVLDANVLYPFSLRDTLLRAAERGLIQIYWSEEILDEVTRNLVGNLGIAAAQANRLRLAMVRAFPEAMASGYEALVPLMPNAEEDRHVAAAAVRAVAHRVVTTNLKDFRELPEGIEACSPDSLLLELLGMDPGSILDLLRDQAGALSRPPRTLDELLAGLAKLVPAFIKEVRRRLADDRGAQAGETP